jgi:pimeloyl-[acyl-carrier protein] synthase
LEDISSRDEVDLIEKVAEALPLAVLGIMLNIPSAESLRKIRHWALEINPYMDTFITGSSFSLPPFAVEGTKIISDFCLNLIEEKKKRLSDDLVSHLILECRLNNISDEVMLGNLVSMLFAAHDSTVNMIGNGLYLFLKYPDQLNTLILDPSLLEHSINEILRFESPVQRATYRITKIDIKIGEVDIPANAQVILFLGAANRDPRMFEHPNNFTISRKHNPHLAFGHGIHNCIGKSLALLEARLLFPRIVKYLTQVKLTTEQSNWRKISIFRGQENLWVKKI